MIKQGKVWGETRPLFNKNNVEFHYIKIKKGGYCSTHLHRSKFNKFIILSGQLKISIWKDYGTETLEDITILNPGNECTVSPGDYHRFEALEDTEGFEIYWVDLSENDIVRKDHGGIKDEKKADQCHEDDGRKGKERSIDKRSNHDDHDDCYCPARSYNVFGM